eukprot:TRINITY_DN6480_c0_g2_i1.p1 TRINITY_DN6480_c0_g2~~TRINITY_DN6480_c0_g2_i1.p1  ORF type:complete len:179 (+),score=21.10 TRINITY_DN6480_c0_g2_i1:41-577(+)
MAKGPLPRFVFVCLLISIPVVLYESIYVLLRPRSIEQSDLGWAFTMYNTVYCQVDKRFCDLEDGYMKAVEIVNLAEIFVGLVAVILHLAGSQQAILWAFSHWVSSLSKTTLHIGIEAMANFPYTGHHIKSGDMNTFYLMYLMPNMLWWFAALISVWLCGSIIGKALSRPVVIVNKKKQ